MILLDALDRLFHWIYEQRTEILLTAASTIGIVVIIATAYVSTYASYQCLNAGYPQYRLFLSADGMDIYCIRRVNQTDEIMRLDE